VTIAGMPRDRLQGEPSMPMDRPELSESTFRFLPVLAACAWPLLQFYGHNWREIDEWQTLLAAFALAALSAALAYGLLRLLFRSTDPARHANLLIVLVVLFFNYHAFDILLRDVLEYPKDEFGFVKARYVLILWTLSTLLAAGITWRLARGRRAWVGLSTVVGVALTLSCVQVLAGVIADGSTAEVSAAPAPNATGDFARRPNIYFFLLDAYARQDTLEDIGFENGEFLDAMAERGFSLVPDSYANYPKTFLSLGTTFNMDYLVEAGEGTVGPSRDYHLLLSGNNNTVNRLKANGYRFLLAAHSTNTCNGFEDLCIRGDRDIGLLSVGELEINLLQMTPVFVVANRFFPHLLGFKDIIPETIEATVRREVYGPGASAGVPTFLFYHNLAAHGSQYGKGCDAFAPYDRPLEAVHRTKDIKLYLTTIGCLNQKIIDLTDAIIERDPEAILIIQSDHGLSLDKWREYEEWTPQDLQFRFGVLNLMRLPEDCRDQLYPTMSPVNTFRLLFACLAGEAPDFLPDESYWVDELGQDRVVLWKVHEK